MKEDIKSLEIRPEVDYIDFIGPAKSENVKGTDSVLKGQIHFTITKPTKIRSMYVKFKGFSRISLEHPTNMEITTQLLPKLKLPLFGKTNLPVGDHVIPWEIEVPNIYPRTLITKRANINYKVIVCINTSIARSVSAECIIFLRRHLLPYKEIAPIIETKIFEQTIPNKFHYEIDAPQIVCLEQKHVPISIKYLSFANQKQVQGIRTRLIQIELYRRQALAKSVINLATDSSNSVEFDFEQKMTASLNQKDLYIKYIKKTEPAMIHIPDTATSSWKKPSLISHQLHPYLSYTLDSPLVSIYHQIEVTFQFEMEYEEIKLMIPLIIASVPKKENAVLYQEESMMKYTFEETARTGFLPYKLENRDLYTDKVKLQSYGDDIYSVLREPDTKMKTLVDESRESLQDGTTDCDDDDILMPYFSTAPNTTLEAKPGFSEPEFHHYGEQPRTLKKYTSAFDLGSGSHSNNMHNIENTPEERPRTTTPTMKRYHPTHHRKVLQPIDVELANNPDKRAKSPHPPPTIPPPPLPVESRSNSHSPSSDILPTVDKHRAVRQELASNYASTKKRDYTKDGLRSPYSEMSSDYEPSLSPSNSRSSTKSYPALQSRPASPLFCTAPGLPATIALQPQESNLFQVEETFPTSDASLSPALNTVASSILLSPRTTNSMRRRIALSTISSLTNDSISNGSSFISRNRASSTVDPDIHSIVAAACSLSSGSSAPPNRYINARLPPLPMLESTDCIENKRLTRLYLEDSDEEDDDETKSIQSYLSVDIGPPRLPRLSFGNDLSISLGIN